MQQQEKKVYQYNQDRVKRSLVSVFRKQRAGMTVADLISATGLPKYQVTETVKVVAHEYAGHLKVTQSGELLYYFPQGMVNSVKGVVPWLKRNLAKMAVLLLSVLTFLFKIWIMVMLIGYFVVFVALLLVAIFVSIAGSRSSSNDDRRSDSSSGFGTFFLATRLIELLIYSGANRSQSREFGGGWLQRPRHKSQPLHRSVFAFVFGDKDPNADWKIREKKAVIRFIQEKKGIITTEELMELSGREYDQAQAAINRYLVEFEGEPEITAQGTLYYRFPALMFTSDLRSRDTEELRLQPLPFNHNKPGLNRWIGFFNGFNLLFGFYFLYYSFFTNALVPSSGWGRFYLIIDQLLTGTAAPSVLLGTGLGLVPVVFSFLFYLLPWIRNQLRLKRNQEIKQQNFRQTIYQNMAQTPGEVVVEELKPRSQEESPQAWERYRERVLDRFGAEKQPDIRQEESGLVYSFPEYAREITDISRFRSELDTAQYRLGETVFDSGK